MYEIRITVDTNDADYNTKISQISEEALEEIKPLIAEIKNCKEHFNFPNSDYRGATPEDLYPNISEEVFDTFYDIAPRGEHGFHTVVSIEICEVPVITKLI